MPAGEAQGDGGGNLCGQGQARQGSGGAASRITVYD